MVLMDLEDTGLKMDCEVLEGSWSYVRMKLDKLVFNCPDVMDRKKPQPGPTPSPSEAPGPLLYTGGFSGALQLSPPPIPPCLLRAGSKVKDTPGMGKVRVMVRISSAHSNESESSSFIRAEVCSGTLADVIQSVVNGADGCIFCYGHTNLGKTYTMIGQDCSTQSLGVAPTAISWLFKVVEERREKAGARLSIWVSAVEISGREETLTDLLAQLLLLLLLLLLRVPPGGPGPAVSLREDPICGSQLQNQTELRANDAERAAFFLDAALAARRSSRALSDQEVCRNSHFLFTLHLYQERMDKSSKAAMSGRSRLHLLDLGSCETDISRTREGGGGQCLSLSALGNVILALANGAKHIPYRDSKLTMLLSESLGNINCRTTMIAHISDSPANYMETLTTVQLASRIHRMRKKKSKIGLEGSGDPDYSSSSEHSCDTVIYIGPGGTAISDRELSDNEGPPSFVPIIPSLNKKRVKDTTESAATACTGKPDQEQSKLSAAVGLMDTSKWASGDGEKLSATPSQPGVMKLSGTCSQDKEPVVREKVYFKEGGPKPSASPSLPRTSRAASLPAEVAARTPPVGMSQQALGQGQVLGPPSMERALHTSRGPTELNNLRAAQLGRCLDRDFLRTTVTLQQPVGLNGEDELVFTVVEELPQRPDSDPATPNKMSLTKCPPSPDLTKASLKGSLRVRANTINSSLSAQIHHHNSHSSLPRKTKPTSSVGVGYSRQEGRHDQVLLQGISHLDSREVEFLSAGKLSKSGTSSASSKRPSGNSNSVPRPPKSNGQKSSMISKSGSGNNSPSALKMSNSDIGKSSFSKRSSLEEEFTARLRADSFIHRTSSLKTDHGSARTSSSPKTRGAKADPSKHYGSLLSLERCDSQTSAGSKSEIRESSAGGGNSRSNRSVPRLGVPASTSTSSSSSQVSSGIFAANKPGQVRGSSSSRAAVPGGSKVRTLTTSSSKTLSSSLKPPDSASGRSPSLLLTGKSPARSSTGARTGRGTIMGTKQAISRAANSRVSELAAGSPRKQFSRVHRPTDSGTSSISGSPVNTPIPSPYSKITAPRRPQRHSSGHGSDNSSILSGELPPAMGHTALFYHSGGSSGYESMIRDSETTGSTSSTHDSMSESGASSSSRSRVSKSPKKRGNVLFYVLAFYVLSVYVLAFYVLAFYVLFHMLQSPVFIMRRRLIPTPLPDPSSLSRRGGGQWVELPPLGGALREAFEIKVYEIDDVERLRRKEAGSEPFHDVEKGLLYFDARLKMLEKRQQQLQELRSKHERLKVELEEAKSRLMVAPHRWSGEFDVDQDLDPVSQDYLEALVQVTAELEYCVNLCKSRIMMETCFDITVTTAGGAQGGQQEVEV
ncbi:hypothetical protein INR49_020462 [Caranx melampygus]|nr:hypothetical protein INR49_020462 [Caranx melampygus]